MLPPLLPPRRHARSGAALLLLPLLLPARRVPRLPAHPRPLAAEVGGQVLGGGPQRLGNVLRG